MVQQSDEGFHISIEPRTERYEADDARWRTQVGEMAVGLQREVGGVRREARPMEGSKGGAEALVVALGSAGAFSAAVRFFRAWLERDRGRSLKITWTDSGQVQSITFKGEAIDDEAIAKIAAAANRIGGAGWNPGIAPS